MLAVLVCSIGFTVILFSLDKNIGNTKIIHAQSSQSNTGAVCDPATSKVGCINNPVKNTATVGGLFTKVMNIIFGSIAIAAVVMVMLGGFKLITGSSNPAERTKAKDTIVWAIIGLIIALMSYSIVIMVQRFFSNTNSPV